MTGKTVMSTSQDNTNVSSNESSVTVTPDVGTWVQEIKRQANLIAEYKKHTEHWQKRELDSSIVCGEYLIKIRMTYGDRGCGFKQFVIDELQNEFSYTTALRYMKLHHGRKEITADISNIRQAYIKLGILKQSYLYPEDESESPSGATSGANSGANSGSTGNQTPKQPNPRKPAPKKNLNDLLPHSKSVYITWKDEANPNSTHSIYEFTLNDDNVLIGRPVTITEKFSIVKPAGVEYFISRLLPLVEWYNQQVNTPGKVTQFEPQQLEQLKKAA